MKNISQNQTNALDVISQVSKILNQQNDLEKSLEQVLQTVAAFLPMKYGWITLLNRETMEINIETAFGLSEQEQDRGKYKLGEGVTGKVVETGEMLVIPDIWKEPRFLNRTQTRDAKTPMSFICVPISYQNEILGTLSSEQYVEDEASLGQDAELLSVIAFLLSEKVSIMRLEQEKYHEDNLRLKEENSRLKEALHIKTMSHEMVGNSSVMQNVLSLIHKIAQSNITALILGESGVGKELVANAIHYNSNRRAKPFIKFNCAALPESIIESELFGHERGAFTGALASRKGRFEMADGGTIFLDEIGDVSQVVQSKLLRVIQEREFERLGGLETRRVDVRIIAATNKNLPELIRAGKFREDLFYRLNVFPINVPALRERKTDIPLLTNYFIEKYSREMNTEIKRISTPAIDLLMSYHWPGNVRELQNCIERAVLLCNDGAIRAYHFPPTLQSSTTSNTVYKGVLQESLDSLEKEYIIEALKKFKGNMSQAANHLGLTERIMGLRMKKYNIQYKQFRLPH